ncbi:metal ABC transporter ATP-binding protein [Lachnospira multipara]|jgi:zinc transport system ATP-binding protein|uniref:metal ABC transporter ATP-binding protein n=1 Tax=Lachnospira multipara TaxID=28051 RepID=UPI0004820734|nr:ABC transporter ATP-binding protein [Lachnospira multipara]
MSIIKVNNLSVGYEGKAVATGLNFTVDEGDYLCIIGENGAGKSTLMKTLLHLIKPIEGNLEYMDGLMPYEIGYLPQHTLVQKDFPASVEEIVLSGLLSKSGLRPFYTKNEKEIAARAMNKMDITHLKKKCYRNLSGGQKQRVLLARALCATSKLLVLDEPTTGLDPKVTEEFYKLISDLNSEGLTVIMVSHDMPSAIKYSNKILLVNQTQKFFGKTLDYIDSDARKEFDGDLETVKKVERSVNKEND